MKSAKNPHIHRKTRPHNRTVKKLPPHDIHGEILHDDREGWKVLHIYGTPQERGYAHGYLLKPELDVVLDKFAFIVNHEMNVTYKHYLATCKRTISPIVQKHYPELYQEMQAIVQGAKVAGLTRKFDLDMLIAWNALMSMYEYLHNKSSPPRHRPGHCSAFIATGDATEDRKIVMAHNTHVDLVSGALFNVCLYMTPHTGHAFVMQTAPGCVASGTDWFLCDTGIIGCETTIADINYRPQFDRTHHPYFCRIRQAMQYGTTLTDYEKIMCSHNAGDYACSWLFGDIRTQEIMLCELGFHVSNVQRTKNGLFYGMNSAMSADLRALETDDQEFFDMSTPSGARNYRFQELLYKKYYGKINVVNAKRVLADHYDTVTQTHDLPSSKTICSHSYDDADPNIANYPHGCTDGKVVDTRMAKKLQFDARWGPCCGRPFDASHFLRQHPEYKAWDTVLVDFPSKKWVTIDIPQRG